MIIVRRKSEILRLGLFLVLMGLMAWFVMSRAASFQEVAAPGAGEGAGAGPAPSGKPAAALPGEVTAIPEPDGRDFYAEAHLARDQDRSLRKYELQAMIDNVNVDAEVRKAAAEELRTAMLHASLETKAEALVLGRGVEEVLVTMTKDAAMVYVRSADSSKQHAVQVADAVATVTGLKLNAVKVRFQE